MKSNNYSVTCFNTISRSENVVAKEKELLEQCETNHLMYDHDLKRELRTLTLRWGALRFFCKKLN